MVRFKNLAASAMVFLSCQVGDATHAPIVLDGHFMDWAGREPQAGEALRAPVTAGLGRMWVAHDEYSLLIRFEVSPEMSLQVDNDLELCLDTDDEASTGLSVQGIGAELCWRFGERRGTFVSSAGAVEIEHQHVGINTTPTVTGTDFELGLARDAEPVPGIPLFPSDTIRVVVSDGASESHIPAAAGGIHHVFDDSRPPSPISIDIARADTGHVRFLSYNLNDHLTEPARRDALGRVLNAVDADVILLQEVRDTPTDAAVAYVRELLERGDETWYTVKVGGESTVVFSSFPILRADSLGDSGGLLLQWGSEPKVLLLVALSLPCCDEQARRSAEADLIAAYVRDAKSGAGEFQIPEDTPIVLMGDANLVGLARDRRTLQYGDIVDAGSYGAGAPPDWDGTPLTDLVPRHTHRPQTFTWHGEEFPPGRLDYMFYSDSNLEIGNRFVLYTPTVPADVLRTWGLESDDTNVVTDHLPVVADVILEPRRTP